MTTDVHTMPAAPLAADTVQTTTAWLARLLLNPASRAVQHDLRDIAVLHRRLMALFPDGLGDSPRARAGLLFRLDHDGTGAPTLLVQSRTAPDASRLPDGYAHVGIREMSPVLEALRPGLTVRYRLFGNAIKRCGRNSTEGRWKQAIVLHGPDAENWWAAQAHRAGLTLHTVQADTADTLTAWHRTGRTAGTDKIAVHHKGTRFDGIATIHDADALRHALLHGIGRSKSYGCGLLSLAPAHLSA
ncbi:type I-E CRISPR-associated protein Cas6/Cse3/CasE [Streptomyces sp. UNOC14_S4]|uniref:type I-E CRISPR-associated protein Cas6/Cse3/CasE n=1 Tax=Streptomyces sp. UNOC14_S4 TaxID=2872340 RepID=UPI001E4E93BC|nr:type I-E CRISPR-associated protein Cas6/Cse3/CasE [Streptomyces sp. UNOC14_S4]MCC3768638.1 type I-E CRISPR-associated protein Cas6/Cse3/CasE [Streptomyces sp. UNOC14_S4]